MGFHREDLDSFEKVAEGYLRQFQGHHDDAAPWDETDFPSLDIYETTGFLIVEAELAGIEINDIEVSVTGGSLLIEGFKQELLKPGRINFLCMERTFGAFRRIVPFLQPVDVSQIEAVYRCGILQVRIPRLPERRGVRRIIPVEAG